MQPSVVEREDGADPVSTVLGVDALDVHGAVRVTAAAAAVLAQRGKGG